jgi:hypothetical protein
MTAIRFCAFGVERSAAKRRARRTPVSMRDGIGSLATIETPVSRSKRRSRLPTTIGDTRPASSGTAT